MSLFFGAISLYFNILDEWISNAWLIDPFNVFITHITHENNVWK